MSNHNWSVDMVNKSCSCSCGSWINYDVIGTGHEHYATGCFDEACSDAFYEFCKLLKEYNVKQHNNTAN